MRTIVKIEWMDAQDHVDKWVDEGDATEFGNVSCTIVSVGFLVSRTDKYITLAGDWDEVDKDFGRVTKIPVSWLISVAEISLERHLSPTPEVEK